MNTITDRIDAVTRIPASHLGTKLPAPKSVKIELSPRCNFRCGFCALRTREEQPTKDMDRALYMRIVEEMADAGVQEIGIFYLGESFYLPWLADAVRIAKDAGIGYVFCTTNGSLSTPQKVQDCIRAGLNSLKFSINAHNEAQFARIMGVKASLFRESLMNLASARSMRDMLKRNEGVGDCGIFASSIVYDDNTQGDMDDFLNVYVRPHVDEHYWLPLYSMGAFATAREAELGYKPIAGNQGRLGALVAPLPCWSAFTEGHVRADGVLSACCFDASGDWQMGDLNNVSFMDAWNSTAFQELRAAHIRKDVTGTVCENCIAY